jgi:hypothetical protein
MYEWDSYYGRPKYEDQQAIKIATEVINYLRTRLDEDRAKEIDEAVKEFHSPRFGHPDIASLSKAVSEYEKKYGVSLQKKGEYYTSELSKEEIKSANVQGEMKDFIGSFRKLLNDKRRRN